MLKGLRFTLDLPPVWLAVFAALAWALARWVPVWRFDVAPFGQILIVAALALIGWSAFWFWRKDTPIEPGNRPDALIVEGPYRLNRNPIYTGLALILLGFALNRGGLSGLIPALIFPGFLSWRFIAWEEAALRERFGAEAERYIANTRRW